MSREFLEECLAKGMSLEAIGREVGKHPSTVRYWLKRYGIEMNSGRRRLRCADGARFASFECKRHGMTEFVLEGRGYYRCKHCRSEAVARRRRAVKQQLVEEAGGECVLCGYSRWPGALQFHHVEADEKEFHLAQGGYSRSIARSRAEMQKCVLLCANCHSEVEGGFATLPVDSIRARAWSVRQTDT